MKKLLTIILTFMLTISLASCKASDSIEKDITTLPKTPEVNEVVEVDSVQELHRGMAWDISSDGKQMIFSWNEDRVDEDPNDELAPPNQLFVMDLASREVKKMSSSKLNQMSAAFSSDSSRIAFIENVEETMKLFVMENKQGGEKTQLTGFGVESSFDWSPDGKDLAIKYGAGKDKILIYDMQGREKNVISDQQVDYMNHPRFYNEDNLIYVINDKIFKKDLTSQENSKKIIDGFNFEISTNKQRLAYFTRPEVQGTGSNLLNVAALGKKLDLGAPMMSLSVLEDSKIVWSPDSKYLLYTEGGNMWVINPENQEKKQIASNVGYIITLLWKSEKEIVYSSITADPKDAARIYEIKLK
jgi:dipeptidyl aminopeptidase/acylaminoacyl peptidase